MRRVALAALAAVALAGCGSSSTTSSAGSATLWVTRDRGAHVLHVARVPAGISVMQALERVANVKTRFGGRYVRAVDGVEEHGHSAWFYYVDGYLADRSAADYRLRAGELAWWDYRSWRDPAQDPVVVGAFPEPFLHGYAGTRRPVAVVTNDRVAGRALARLLHGRISAKPPPGANVLYLLGRGRTRLVAGDSGSAGSPVRFRFSGDWHLLLRGRYPFRFRYSLP